MTSSNLGDSAFILIRDRKVFYESPSQQHFFNGPCVLNLSLLVPRVPFFFFSHWQSSHNPLTSQIPKYSSSYQLTVVPDNYPNHNMYIRDQPKDAQRSSFTLQNGDLIVQPADGFFDNVYSHEALAIVNHELAGIDLDHYYAQPHHPPHDPEPNINVEQTEDMILRVRNLCRKLTDTARRFSLDPNRMSPWAMSARKHGGRYLGGKEDDITCIVTP